MSEKNYAIFNIGKLSNIINQGEKGSKGKFFIKEKVGLTGSEISFTSIPPKTELPFFHSHKQNEEVYIFLSGKGFFQVDDNVFDISEGSIVKVAPKGLRNLYNSSNEEMLYIVIQTKENSLEQYTMSDGIIAEYKTKWKKED